MTTELTEPEYTKTDDDLKWYARDFLRRCESKMYRRLSRDGELENYLQLLAVKGGGKVDHVGGSAG